MSSTLYIEYMMLNNPSQLERPYFDPLSCQFPFGNDYTSILLLLGVVAGAAYLIYRQVMASRAEEDLWSEATNAPDFSATYPPAGDAANGDPQ